MAAGRKLAPGLALCALVLAGSLALPARPQDAREGARPRSIRRELADLYKADQADRERMTTFTPEAIQEVSERDRKRRERVAAIVRSGQMRAAEEYYHAAMVFQHGETPEDILTAHELATIAGFKGHKGGRWLSAASLDRYLHKIGRPQRFGTQYQRQENSPWTQEPFDRSMPDGLRKEFGVPPLAVLEKQAVELNRQAPRR